MREKGIGKCVKETSTTQRKLYSQRNSREKETQTFHFKNLHQTEDVRI